MPTTTLAGRLSTAAAAPRVTALRALLNRIEAALARPSSAEQLLARAELYEASQPSFAADLRAAASAVADSRSTSHAR